MAAAAAVGCLFKKLNKFWYLLSWALVRPGQVGLWGFRTKLLCIIAIVLHNIYVYIHIFIYDIISRKCNIKFQTRARTPHCWGTLLMLRQHNLFPHQHKVAWSSELVLSSSSEELQLATVYWLPPYPSGGHSVYHCLHCQCKIGKIHRCQGRYDTWHHDYGSEFACCLRHWQLWRCTAHHAGTRRQGCGWYAQSGNGSNQNQETFFWRWSTGATEPCSLNTHTVYQLRTTSS